MVWDEPKRLNQPLTANADPSPSIHSPTNKISEIHKIQLRNSYGMGGGDDSVRIQNADYIEG